MAEKIRILTKTDCSVSSTGNLGPEVLEDKEKGLVYIAVSRKGKTAVKELKLKGKREEIKEDASTAALRLLIDESKGMNP
jgi:nicotinamide mononucleotide (NMN) deamidase PncC